MQDFIAIPVAELAHATGGAAKTSWDAYVNNQRAVVAAPYKQVVCTAAGVKGGPELATQIYGKDRTTNGDMIRGAETLKGVCMGGSRLPAAAPESPF
jgi:hypothetical protein